MKWASALFTALTAVPIWAQNTVLLDSSGSMAGFAGPETKITGFMQRLGHTLESSGSVTFDAFSSFGGKPALTPLSVNSAALHFANARSFRGNSPLVWSIAAAMHQSTTGIIVLTDGMEDDARLGEVANALAQYAGHGWALGIAAFLLPFDGPYYTEMRIPFAEFQPKIEQAIHAANPTFKVAPASCSASAAATCYKYTGERPLLAFVFSKTGPVDPLFSAVRAAASEALMPLPFEVVLSPASQTKPQLELAMPPASREWLRGPKPVTGGQAVVECIRSSSTPLPVELVLSAPSASTLPEANVAAAVAVTLGPKPNWVRTVSSKLTPQQNGTVQHEATLVCVAPSLMGSLGQSSILLPETLTLDYSFKRVPRTQGWWIDLSAPNSWQYPNKVYHLREVVEQVQSALFFKELPASLKITLQLRSRR